MQLKFCYSTIKLNELIKNHVSYKCLYIYVVKICIALQQNIVAQRLYNVSDDFALFSFGYIITVYHLALCLLAVIYITQILNHITYSRENIKHFITHIMNILFFVDVIQFFSFSIIKHKCRQLHFLTLKLKHIFWPFSISIFFGKMPFNFKNLQNIDFSHFSET